MDLKELENRLRPLLLVAAGIGVIFSILGCSGAHRSFAAWWMWCILGLVAILYCTGALVWKYKWRTFALIGLAVVWCTLQICFGSYRSNGDTATDFVTNLRSPLTGRITYRRLSPKSDVLSSEEGPLTVSGKRHGHWQHRVGITREDVFYWHGLEVSEGEFQIRSK